ncbi:MAG: hypothetical protein Q8R72_08010 [Hylemonella sp.]|nr:hypothetical protein [Hylemonella sp.]
MDTIVNSGAIAYGLVLVAATFVRTPVTEALRIDALFMPQADERTRPLNLIFGLLIAGYGAWSLWAALR